MVVMVASVTDARGGNEGATKDCQNNLLHLLEKDVFILRTLKLFASIQNGGFSVT